MDIFPILRRCMGKACQVDCVKFTVLSADEISTYSEVEVLNQNNYDA